MIEPETLPLPPYVEHTRCPKCRCEEVSTTYHPERAACGRGNRCSGTDPACRALPERLERQCQRCRYGWVEAIADPTPDLDPF